MHIKLIDTVLVKGHIGKKSFSFQHLTPHICGLTYGLWNQCEVRLLLISASSWADIVFSRAFVVPRFRVSGKTVECGRAYFETENKHFTLLDAPGHRSFVPNMIGGACQADIAVLVISARKGEFETGFERGGQTREHAMLAKTAGVKHLIVLINKMDDSTVNWSEERFNECRDKLLPYLKKCGFNPKTELIFMPCSGLSGAGLKDPAPASECSWYTGPCFLPYIDQLKPIDRYLDGPFVMPVVDRYKDMGTVCFGKVESGMCDRSDPLLLMPNRKVVEVLQLWSDEDEVQQVKSGENVKVKLKGLEEEEVSPGFVLCEVERPCKVAKVFDAQVVILEHKSIICPGYSCVLHIHAAIEECSVRQIICLIDRKTGEKGQMRPRFVKQDQVAVMRLETAGVVCVEPFKLFPQMGRFTLRDEGRTIAIGKVLRVVEWLPGASKLNALSNSRWTSDTHRPQTNQVPMLTRRSAHFVCLLWCVVAAQINTGRLCKTSVIYIYKNIYDLNTRTIIIVRTKLLKLSWMYFALLRLFWPTREESVGWLSSVDTSSGVEYAN